MRAPDPVVGLSCQMLSIPGSHASPKTGRLSSDGIPLRHRCPQTGLDLVHQPRMTPDMMLSPTSSRHWARAGTGMRQTNRGDLRSATVVLCGGSSLWAGAALPLFLPDSDSLSATGH